MTKEEFSNLLHGYHKNPRPELIPAAMVLIESERMMNDKCMELVATSACIAFAEIHPELNLRETHPTIYRRADSVIETTDLNRVGWNDYYMVRWFILGKDDDMREIIRRTRMLGQIGHTATWMLMSCSHQYPFVMESVLRLDEPLGKKIQEVIAFRAASISH